MKTKKLKCVLVIGHRKKSAGAYNRYTGITEFGFNQPLSYDIKEKSTEVDIDIVYRHTYKSLPVDINQLNPDFIISLHCNSFNKNVSGTEVLYHHRCLKSKKAAETLQHHLSIALGLKDRGVKPKHVEDNGGYLLKYTAAPCIIAEPFFIDNDDDLQAGIDNRQGLINAYVQAITIIAQQIGQQ